MTKAQREHYDECISNGCSPALAEVLALQQPPSLVGTDSQWLQGANLAPHDRIEAAGRKALQRRGVSTTGKQHISQLGPPTDPTSYVGSLGELKSECERRGLSAVRAGKEIVKARQRKPKPEVAVAADILEREASRAIAADPGLAAKPRQEVKEMVEDKIRPHWKKSKLPLGG